MVTTKFRGYLKAVALRFSFCFILVSKELGDICWICYIYTCCEFTFDHKEGKMRHLDGLNTTVDACDYVEFNDSFN